MARPGICYQAVKEAAAALLHNGVNPSIQRIRDRLGTGSNSTIGRYLKQWQEEMVDSSQLAPPPPLPEAVKVALAECWKTALEEAEGHYQERREQAELAVATAEKARAEAYAEMVKGQEEAAALREALAALQQQTRELQDALLLETERRHAAEASIATAEQRATAAAEGLELLRRDSAAQLAKLEEQLRQNSQELNGRLAQAEQQLGQERQRGEAREAHLLQLIDQHHLDQAAERATWQAREASLRKQLDALQEDCAAVRLSAADAGERAKLLEQESHRLLAKLSEWQDKYLAAARRLESLRKELTRRQRHALAERRHYHRRAQKLRVPSDH